MPMNQGFDYFYGMPYSNDMSIAKEFEISSDLILNDGCTLEEMEADRKNYLTQYRKLRNKIPMLRGNTIIEYPVDQRTITSKYTNEAVKFINDNKNKPFFLYLAHTMPHKPLFVEDDRKGGLYGDIIEHIDWSVGEVIKALKANGNFANTFIIYTSDNGFAKGAGGSAGELRGMKFLTWEGGQRIPTVMNFPTKIKGGRTLDGISSTIDLFQTIAKYSNSFTQQDRTYDGYDLSSYLNGETAESPRNEFFFYRANSENIDGVRVGDWKYLIYGDRPARDNGSQNKPEPKLFNLKDDVGETKNLINDYPEKAAKLIKIMKEFDSKVTQK